jgi:hypothetical protein
MGPKQGTGSKTPAAKVERKPIYDKLLGRIDEIPCAAPIDHPPKVQKFGICSKPTEAVKKPIDGASMMVRSNYVRVTKVPTDHNVYSLDFSCPSKDGSGRHRLQLRGHSTQDLHAVWVLQCEETEVLRVDRQGRRQAPESEGER